jgi:hypothetical protein
MEGEGGLAADSTRTELSRFVCVSVTQMCDGGPKERNQAPCKESYARSLRGGGVN